MRRNRTFKSNHNVIYSCKFHVIWCTKYRRDVLVNDIADRLKDLLQSIASEHQADLIEQEVMPDHIHLLVEIDPQYGIHRLVKAFKGNSSRVLRYEFPWLKSRIPTLWTNAYFVASVGGVPWAVIKQYIERQKDV